MLKLFVECCQILSILQQTLVIRLPRITKHCFTLFQPLYLDVINESYMHNVPKGMIYTKHLLIKREFKLDIGLILLLWFYGPQLCLSL